jgi:hypothetical protein
MKPRTVVSTLLFIMMTVQYTPKVHGVEKYPECPEHYIRVHHPPASAAPPPWACLSPSSTVCVEVRDGGASGDPKVTTPKCDRGWKLNDRGMCESETTSE